jgi:outer membrane receptor protein involved in Fe transport
VRNILIHVFLVVFCLAAATADAGQSALSGVVKDESGGVVSGAAVIVRSSTGGERQTVSGPDGRFTIDRPGQGDGTLIVRAGGFAEWQRPLSSDADVEVVLKTPTLLESVTVTPTRSEQRLGDVPASVSIVDKEEIRQSPAVVIDDVLRQVPSFSLFRRSSSLSSHPTSQGVSLRGIGPSGVSRTLVMTDGVPVNDPFGGWVYWTRVPMASVDRIEVVEGASSSLYGNYAEGGVINIVTARPARRTVEVKPQYGNRTSPKFDFLGSDVWGKVGVLVEGSLFKTDGFPIVAPAERGAIDINATTKFQNVNTKVDYSPNDRVRASFRVGYFNEDRSNGKIDEVNDTRWTSLSGTLRTRLPDSSDLQASVFGDFEKFHSTFLAVSAINGVPRSAVRLTLDQHVPTDSVGASMQWSRALGRVNFFTAGADWRWVDGDSNEDAYTQVGPLVSPVTSAALSLQRVSGGTQQSAGAFVQDIINPLPRLSITLSARIDHWRSYDAHNDETSVPAGTPGPGDNPSLPEKSSTVGTPRAAAIYHLTDRVNVWGSVARGFRAPTLNELYRQFRVGTTLTLANFALEPERLTSGEAGVSVAVTDRLSVRATAFDNTVRNPVFNVTTAIAGANITQQRQNVPRTNIHGFQTDVEFRAGSWRAGAAYVHNNAVVKEYVTPAASNIPSILGNFLAQVPRNRGSAQVAYSNPKLATIAFAVQGIGAQFDDDLNLRVLPSYGLADLSVSRTINRNVDVFVGVQNMFDKQYVVATLPTTIGTPRLVNGGIRVRFSGQ